MIKGIVLTIIVLAVMSYLGFDLNSVVNHIVIFTKDAWTAITTSTSK